MGSFNSKNGTTYWFKITCSSVNGYQINDVTISTEKFNGASNVETFRMLIELFFQKSSLKFGDGLGIIYNSQYFLENLSSYCIFKDLNSGKIMTV